VVSSQKDIEVSWDYHPMVGKDKSNKREKNKHMKCRSGFKIKFDLLQNSKRK
jgi:hypothetical protein